MQAQVAKSEATVFMSLEFKRKGRFQILTWLRFVSRGVWGAEPLAQSLWLKAKEIVRAKGESPIVNQTSRSARPTRAKRAWKSPDGVLRLRVHPAAAASTLRRARRAA